MSWWSLPYVRWNPLRIGPYVVRRHVVATLVLLLGFGGQQLLMPTRLDIPYEYIVKGLRFSPDGQWLAIQQIDVDIWSVHQQRIEHTLPCDSRANIAWHDDGSRFACAIDEGIGVWDTSTWQRVMVLPWTDDDFCYSIGWSPDGQRIGAVTHQSDIVMWEAATGKMLWSKPSDGENWGSGWFMPDGVYVTNRSIASTQTWDTEGNEVAKPELPGEILATSHDRRLLALYTRQEDQFGVWNISEKRMVATMKGHQDELNDAAFSPDDRMLVTVSGSSMSGVTDVEDQVVRVWSTENGSQVRTFHAHSYIVNAVDWSPDGQVIVSGSSYVAVNRWRP